jgi:hypothetical protein
LPFASGPVVIKLALLDFVRWKSSLTKRTRNWWLRRTQRTSLSTYWALWMTKYDLVFVPTHSSLSFAWRLLMHYEIFFSVFLFFTFLQSLYLPADCLLRVQD